MPRSRHQALSPEALKSYLERFTAGECFEQLLADWTKKGLAVASLKDLLRGAYSSAASRIAYEQLGYERRSIQFAPRNFRAKLLAPELLRIRQQVREGADPKVVAEKWRIDPATVREIVTGRYSTLAMNDALATEAEALP
jgi:DNA-binding NarL/FixJ family response regulator